MPIRCGTNKVRKIYCGEDDVERSLCGLDRSYGPSPRLPSYAEIYTHSVLGVLPARLAFGILGNGQGATIFGGRAASSVYHNDFYSIDGHRGTSRQLAATGATIPVRAYTTMVGNVQYGLIIGGWNGSANLSDAYRVLMSNTSVAVTALIKAGDTFPAQHGMIACGDFTKGVIFGGRSAWPPNMNTFYSYTVPAPWEANNTTITFKTLTTVGSISNRSGVAMVGNEKTGIIFGGYTTAAVSDFYRYVVEGDNVTVTLLTKLGDTTIAGVYAAAMVGDDYRGWIFGGSTGSSNAAANLQNKLYYYEATESEIEVAELKTWPFDQALPTARRYAGMTFDHQSLTRTGETHALIVGGDGGSNTPINQLTALGFERDSVTVEELDATGTTIAAREGAVAKVDGDVCLVYGGAADGRFYRCEKRGDEINVVALTATLHGHLFTAMPSVTNPGWVGNTTTGVIFDGDNIYAYTATTTAITITRTQKPRHSPPRRSSRFGGQIDWSGYPGGSGTLSNYALVGQDHGVDSYFIYDGNNFFTYNRRFLESSFAQPAGYRFTGSSEEGLIFNGGNFWLYKSATPTTTDYDTNIYINRKIVTTALTKVEQTGDEIGALSNFGITSDRQAGVGGTLGTLMSGFIFGGQTTERKKDWYRFEVIGTEIHINKLSNFGDKISARSNMAMGASIFGTSSGSFLQGFVFGGNTGSATNDFFHWTGWHQADVLELQPGPSSVTGTDLTEEGATVAARSWPKMVNGVLFGGWTGAPANDFYSYTQADTDITFTALTKTGSIPARFGFGMVDGVIFGGGTSTTNFLNDFYRYAVASNTVALTALTKAGASITARYDMGMVGDASSGLIFGGGGVWEAATQNDFYSYTVSGNTITLTALTKAGASISPRLGMGMVGSARSGVIFGGYTGSAVTNDFYSYTVSGNTVTLTALAKAGASISARHQMAMVGFGSGIIFGGLSGGAVSSAALGDMYYYIVQANTVFLRAVTGLTISARSHVGIEGGQNGGIIFGGWSGTSGLLLGDAYKYTTS